MKLTISSVTSCKIMKIMAVSPYLGVCGVAALQAGYELLVVLATSLL